MSTMKFRGPGAPRDLPVLARADVGAQYITTRSSPSHPLLGPIYDRLLKEGLLKSFDGKVDGPNPYGGAGGESVRHYVPPEGLQAIVEYFLTASGVVPEWGCVLKEISLTDGSIQMRISRGNGTSQDTDEEHLKPDRQVAVVLTQPVPQVLGESKFGLRGNLLESTDAALLAELRQVQYSSRFAAAYFFEQLMWPYDFAVRYFDGGDVRYVTHDSAKRGATGEPFSSVVVHGSVPLGLELIAEEEPFCTAAKRLGDDLAGKLPEIPWASASSKVHKWKYSQVYKGLGGRQPRPNWVWEGDAADVAPGVVSLARTASALCLLSGDAVAPASNFEGCVFSAFRTVAAIQGFALEQAAKQ